MKGYNRSHLCKCGICYDDICTCVNPRFVVMRINKELICQTCDKWKCRCCEQDEDACGVVLLNKCNNTIEKQHYILSISDRAKLRNGFRYIKELLLQQHN